MRWTFDHSQLPVYLKVMVEGQANATNVRALIDEMIASESWHSGLSVLVDISEMTPVDTGRNALIQDIVRYFTERRREIGNSCIATVRPRAEAYNYIRQFEYGIRLRGSEAVVRNFMSMDHAAEWLTNHAGICGTGVKSNV